MAEFSEVMRQWTRMCNAVPGKSECISICRDKQSGYTCPMYSNGLCNKSISSQTDKDRLAGEKTIMQWAAEHPEPVYPTWVEWLSKQGLVEIKEGQFVNQGIDTYVYENKTVVILNNNAAKPIPADLAQKLGLQPKEG